MKKIRLAIDIGASSGRHLATYKVDGKDVYEEVYRFPNFMDQNDFGLTWDVERLFSEILEGIRLAFIRYGEVLSIGIDTWGVDYVLLDKNQNIIEPAYAYRNQRTRKVIDHVHQTISFDELYQITGTQFQPFNTIYQLACDERNHRLDHAAYLLMLPEYFYYRLTGFMVHEYTNATTTGLVNVKSKTYDEKIIKRLGFPSHLFTQISQPGIYHELKEDIQKFVGGFSKVCLVATHDTASSVEGIKILMHQAYVSSGTWSLLGMKVLEPITTNEAKLNNFSHEGGIGYLRFQKNIMGLWIMQCLKNEYKYESFVQMMEDAKTSSYIYHLDVNHERYLAPKSMVEAIYFEIESQKKVLPKSKADVINCVCHSLAKSYQIALIELEQITKQEVKSLTVFGGGANNTYLNQLIKEYTQKDVIVYPIEATAIGNLKIQETYDETL